MVKPSFISTLTRLTETLALAGTGGALFAWLGLPAGWLSGAMLFVAVAALAGRPVEIPVMLARTVFVGLGISLGAVVTPETLKGVSTWPLSIGVLVVAMVSSTFANAFYLRVVHRWESLSAYLAASPGALSQAVMVATQNNADVRGIAIVQTVRVAILTVGLPAGLSVMGLAPPPVTVAVDLSRSLPELAILIAASAVTALIFQRIRFPGGLIFGAMLASAILHGTGLVSARLPWWVLAAAACGLGSVTGSRFANTPMSLLLDYIAAALGSFLIGVTIAALFAFALIEMTQFHAADVVVSFAPGALDVMMILALAMHLDPVYVGAHHVARFVLVSLLVPILARALVRRPPKKDLD